MMTNSLKTLILCVGCSFLACNSQSNTVANEAVDDYPSVNQSCYLFTEEAEPIMEGNDTLLRLIDSTYLTIIVEGESVHGVFENKPAEKDAAIGTYEGQIDRNGFVKGLYHYSQEGDVYDDFIQIRHTENLAHMRFVTDSTTSMDDSLAGDWFILPVINCPK